MLVFELMGLLSSRLRYLRVFLFVRAEHSGRAGRQEGKQRYFLPAGALCENIDHIWKLSCML